ncbi:MAG: adenylate kinase [Anaerolineaceae bacterium]|nr:adenylate kinase [Anaerolineaceae bacterium]
MARYIVMLGPPGAGKGTQAKILSEKLSLAHVSSGDLFRENIRNETELGLMAQAFMVKGDLVPDEVTIGMIRERLKMSDCEKGAILDGFPRTIPQAEALDTLLEEFNSEICCTPFISVPDEVLIERLGGRWTCPECSRVYHETYSSPVKAGLCDADGAVLIQREDDKPETVLNRIKVYFDQTMPLLEYYQESGKRADIDGTRSIEEISNSLTELPALR